MRDRRFVLAVKRDKEAFAEKECARQDGVREERLSRVIREKKIVYRPGLCSIVRTQLCYMSIREYGAYGGGLLAVLALTGYVQGRGLLAVQEVFALAAVWMIFAAAIFAGGLEMMAENHMGELAASCYFNLGQLVCVRLITGAAGQLFALAAFHAVLDAGAAEGGAPMGLYLLLVCVAADAVYFFIFAAVRGRGQLLVLFAAALLLSVTVCFVSIVADALFLLSAGVCAVILLLCAAVLLCEITYVAREIRKGEILCFD